MDRVIYPWWGFLRVVSKMPTQEANGILASIGKCRPTRPSILSPISPILFWGGSPRNMQFALGGVYDIALGDATQKRVCD